MEEAEITTSFGVSEVTLDVDRLDNQVQNRRTTDTHPARRRDSE